MNKLFIIAFLGVLLAGCQSKEATNPQDIEEVTSPQDIEVSSTPEAQSSTPSAQPSTHSTLGKVVATRYADVSFESALPIVRILVKNGQQVRQGQMIAELDKFKLNNKIEQELKQIEQAELQMQEVIITQGYDPDKPADIPAEVKRIAEIKSGIQLTRNQLEAAEHELKTAVLTAPFNGIVANLKAQANELSKPGEPICRIISTQDMAVEFRVMESDLACYPFGTVVIVVPVAYKGRQFKATVNEINPIVDAQGAVSIRARLEEAQDLFDGMNVEILTVER